MAYVRHRWVGHSGSAWVKLRQRMLKFQSDHSLIMYAVEVALLLWTFHSINNERNNFSKKKDASKWLWYQTLVMSTNFPEKTTEASGGGGGGGPKGKGVGVLTSCASFIKFIYGLYKAQHYWTYWIWANLQVCRPLTLRVMVQPEDMLWSQMLFSFISNDISCHGWNHRKWNQNSINNVPVMLCWFISVSMVDHTIYE